MATLPATTRSRDSRPLPHPAKGVLVSRRITNRSVAITLGMSELVVGRWLNGFGHPSPRFRAGLAELLGEPQVALFRDDERGGR